MIRRATARAILGAGFLVVATGIGATVRGPQADGVLRDTAAGLGVIGAAYAVRWAARELGHPDDLEALAGLSGSASALRELTGARP